MPRSLWRFLAAAALTTLAAAHAGAQFSQYTSPGGPGDPDVSKKGQLDAAVDNARWRLGPVRIAPWFGVSDVGYVNDGRRLEGETRTEQRQLAATGGAGFRAYLPTGPKVTWAAHLLPEYTWAEDPELRRTNGRYGVGVFAFFNRLVVEAHATRTQLFAVATPEVLRRSDSRGDRLFLSAEVEAIRSLHVFARLEKSAVTNLTEDLEDVELARLALLDRDEQIVRAGLRLRARDNWVLAAGVERSEVDFESVTADRSNSGNSPFVEISRDGNSLDFSLDLVARQLEPERGSSFTPFDEVTGNFSVKLDLGRIEPSFYAGRNLVYSIEDTSTYLLSDRAGLALKVPLGSRGSISAFVEQGRDDYVSRLASGSREDDQQAWGAALQLRLRGNLSMVLGFSREDYTSNLPNQDRKLDSVRAAVTLGSGPSPWY